MSERHRTDGGAIKEVRTYYICYALYFELCVQDRLRVEIIVEIVEDFITSCARRMLIRMCTLHAAIHIMHAIANYCALRLPVNSHCNLWMSADMNIARQPIYISLTNHP